ncbi:LysE/ArgO family amino acid transporter [uncultured Bdellovibrio sp.]|uniref:LysE/ArgO family amino acid transporter n=1 Tax=Bdellovibrio sp. HCB-162 TaxID=3394234 RepID=UPI0025D694D0|nr:LysE family transporter [uncultured Bdellovibrio sp.]
MSSYFLQGFLLQGSLIFALGAQNIFVLESGLRKNNPALVALVCTLCDLFLILLGVVGAASVFIHFPIIKVIFGVLGVLFLLYYGVQKIREDVVTLPLATRAHRGAANKIVMLQALAFSLLNPHVYLDTVVLIGGVSAKFPELTARLVFAAGASTFSAIWFFGLGLGATKMRPLLQSAQRLRRVMVVAGIILILIGLQLAREVWTWGLAL